MGKIITFGIQKGGSGKTTTAGVVAYILFKQGYKVLAVDMDSQGNLTEMLTQRDIYDFHGETVLEAMKDENAEKYIHKIKDNLDILTSEDHLATFPRWLYTNYKGNRSKVLQGILENVQDRYDYIIIDTPPALSDQTVNALAASDAVVVLFETSKFCYSALERFIETVNHAQEMVNPKLKIAGILCTIIDIRRSDTKALLELVEESYGALLFNTIINRRASIGRLSIHGFFENPELKQALEQYESFTKELLERVQS